MSGLYRERASRLLLVLLMNLRDVGVDDEYSYDYDCG